MFQTSLSTHHRILRIELQRREHDRQKDKLFELATTINNSLVPDTAKSVERLNKLRIAQKDIGLRIDRLIKRLVDHCQLPLSQHEQQFIKFIRELDIEVSDHGGCQDQLDDVSIITKQIF